MTREEAIKYLRINRKAMTAQMKLALETLVPELREDVEHVCGTCTYWQDGALDRGECQAGEPHQTHSAETCERWERQEEIRIKEQPCEDLKGEIREWVDLMVGASFPEQDGDYISEEDYRSVIRQTALHFYELGKQSKEPVSEDLEEAVENIYKVPFCTRADAFIAGAEWQKDKDTRDMYMSDNRHFQKIYELGRKEQKEQMMKEAVEGKIVISPDNDCGYICGWLDLHKIAEFKDGDKVKIIIVKEDTDE